MSEMGSLIFQEERVEILRSLSSKLPLCEDVDVETIASLTDCFSGADLQALLYTSQIKALHEIQYTSPSKRKLFFALKNIHRH